MKQIHGETFRADFHFTQSLTSMFLHLELSALLIKSAAGCTVSSTHSKGLEWFLCGVWESKRGWKVTGDSGCVEFCSERSLIPLWAKLWCLWDWAENRKDWAEWSNIGKSWLFLLPVPSLENKLKWNYLHCNIYSRFLFCLFVFFLSSPTVGTVPEYYREIFSVSCGSFILVNLKLHRLFQEALI